MNNTPAKYCCTLEQSKRLRELGVDAPSMFYWRLINEPIGYKDNHEYWELCYDRPLKCIKESCPAYSVGELGDMIPDTYVSYDSDWQYRPYKQDYHHTQQKEWKFDNPFTEYNKDTKVLGGAKTEAQARAAMLIWLIENNHITAEEVNNQLK